MTESDEKLSLDKRLGTLSFNKDPEPFITVDTETCFKCEKKPCLYICPAQVYVWEEKLVYNTEGCMETGACLIVCHKLGAKAIHWKNPSGGHGVTFTQGYDYVNMSGYLETLLTQISPQTVPVL